MDTLKAPVNELARACAHSADAREWEEFLRRCAPIATLVARRIARMWMGIATPSVVDDIVQEAFLKLCEQERRILRDFKPRSEDSFFGLLRVVTASVANDYFRRQHSEKRGGKVVTMTLDDDPTSAVAVSTETTAQTSQDRPLHRAGRRNCVNPRIQCRTRPELSSGSTTCRAPPRTKSPPCRLGPVRQGCGKRLAPRDFMVAQGVSAR